MSHFQLVSIKNPRAGIEANSDGSLYGEGVYHPPYKGPSTSPGLPRDGCTDEFVSNYSILLSEHSVVTNNPFTLISWNYPRMNFLFIFKIVYVIILNKY